MLISRLFHELSLIFKIKTCDFREKMLIFWKFHALSLIFKIKISDFRRSKKQKFFIFNPIVTGEQAPASELAKKFFSSTWLMAAPLML